MTTSQLARLAILPLACAFLSFSTLAAPTSLPAKPAAVAATPAKPAPLPANVVAKVIWVKGVFKAMSQDMKLRPLVKGDLIFLHDTLSTDDQTTAQIVFTDDTMMTFRPASQFYINSYSYTPKQGKGSTGKYIVNLLEGGFRTITGLIAKANPSDYVVNTPVATIGVRGTDYAVYLDKNGQIYVGYYKGSPCVSSKNHTLCLDNVTPYATANANSAPVPMSQQPPQLGNKLPIINTTFIPPGGGFTGAPPTATQILNSFCIQ